MNYFNKVNIYYLSFMFQNVIYVKKLTGKHLCLDFEPAKTIENIKTQIQSMEGFTIVRQRLIFAGKDLDDGFTLAHYNIQRESILNLILHSNQVTFSIFVYRMILHKSL